MSTISDVAKAAGVSVATVSRALRGLDRVNPQTRAKVLQVAEQLQYVASPTAASLASGRTRVVGVVAPFLTRWFFATLLSGIEKSLREHGHHVVLFDLEAEPMGRRMRLTQSMLWKRVDGVVVLNVPMDDAERELIERLELPVVTVGNRVGGWPCVRIDDTAAMVLAAQHVIDLGHTEIAYVGVVPHDSDHLQTPLERRSAFLATMEAAGLSCPPEWLVDSDWTASGAAAHVVPVLTGAHRPTAVVAASDEMAIGVLCAARRLGIAVPGELSVVGIDDHTFADVMDLSTVRQNVDEQGRRAGQILMGQILGSDTPPPDELVLPVELVVRSSTAAPCRPANP
ncbi:transcriptional regulator, LacI family [Pedococcus cremeus]|uniref:Transcriptional regulator, LacI family n=1 Tax=Pedococcus cremeus TaxID=587636 RepID=A0A1H9T6L4_9MICO|nr:LacI family DNA-binding transcriptional regulator [Pedococcus cremeus]SER92788.1 transcriptional regulator, LacI family [Pedococcus cremeus]